MADYATAVGFVQFPVQERELDNGDTVRDVTIRIPGVDAPLIKVTLWPELADTDVEEGDFIAVDGAYKERSGQKKDGSKTTFRDMNAKKLVVITGAGPVEREVVNKATGSKVKARAF